MDLTSGGASFPQLLHQLNEEHNREVAELQETIQALRQTIANFPRWPSHFDPPRGDSHAAAAEDDIVDKERILATKELNQGAVITIEGLNEDNAGLVACVDGVIADPELLDDARGSDSELPPARRSKSRLKSGSFQRTPSTAPSKITMSIDTIIGCIIIVNIVFIFVRLDYQGYMTAVEIGLDEKGKWPDLDMFFEVMQHLFCAIFLIELICRVAVFRLSYFYSEHFEKFNIFDAVIVLFTCIDLYIITPFFAEGNGSDLTVIRAMRFVRLLRAMRVVRTFEIFSKLRVLLSTVVASFYALLWSMVLLFITMLMAALVLTQIINPFIADPQMPGETVEWMFLHYGTAGRSLWTVFEITFSGGWPNYARRLVEEVSVGFAWFFAVYISTVVFAMTRIITALFLKDTLAVAANDAEMMIQEKTREKKAYAAKLLEVFEAADASGDGLITFEEFENFVNDPIVKTYLATLELDANETKNLFCMLDDGDGHVTAEEFVQGAVRLKGVARSQDVVSIMHDFTRMGRHIHALQSSIHELHEKL